MRWTPPRTLQKMQSLVQTKRPQMMAEIRTVSVPTTAP
jgi:hypothetical protein